MRVGFLALGTLALAACGEAPEQAPRTESEVTPAEAAAPEAAADAEDGSQSALANRIPTRFHGAWDYEGGTCAPESDMRMEISSAEILFYESIGIVTGIEYEGYDAVVSLAMEGEGETWEEKIRLSLVDADGTSRLHTSDGEMPKQVDDYPRMPCP
jgi:hypothetical protein